MIDNLKKEVEKYRKVKTQALDYNQIKKNDKGDIIDLESLDDLYLIKDPSYRDMLHICIEEEIILKNNIKFFEKKLKNIL